MRADLTKRSICCERKASSYQKCPAEHLGTYEKSTCKIASASMNFIKRNFLGSNLTGADRLYDSTFSVSIIHPTIQNTQVGRKRFYVTARLSKIKIEQKKASGQKPRKPWFYWQRGWDSNPRQLITALDFESSTFDHSDTSPFTLYATRSIIA